MQTREILRTRDQQYASAIYEQVMKVKEEDKVKRESGAKGEDIATSYGSMAHTLPILIHTSGLAQALAFVASRKDDAGAKRLLQDLHEIISGSADGDLLQSVRGSDLREYMYLTEQALAALLWYKRYAQAILGVKAGEQGEKSPRGGQ